MRTVNLAIIAIVVSDSIGSAADWPQFRGPGGQGNSIEKGIPVRWGSQEGIAWKTQLPGAGTSSPIVLGERLYVTCFSGEAGKLNRQLVCLDRRTGKLIWKKEVASKLPEQETIRENHGYASSTPVADAERVYAFFGKSGVFAFDHSGRQIWQSVVGSQLHGWGTAASPVLFGELLIVNASVESESLVALNRRTGQEVWRARGIKDSWNTPILVALPGGKTELVVAVFGKVLGFDPASGKPAWSCATDIGWYMVPSLVSDRGVVYCIGGRTGGALAVRAGGRGDVTQTHRLWTARKGSNVSSPVIHTGYLYWVHENLGVAYCADAQTGRFVYEERLAGGGQFYASPVVADGKLYFVNRRGRVFVLAAKPQFELLATNDFEANVFNASPAIAAGALYVRSDKFLYCVRGSDKRAQSENSNSTRGDIGGK